MNYKSVKNFNRKINSYRKMCKIKKMIICWHKEIFDFAFFNYDNLDHIKENKNIEVIWIPENSESK